MTKHQSPSLTHRAVPFSVAQDVTQEGPELLAVIRVTGGKNDGREIVVVKRGGDPVHVSEVIPDALDSLLPKPAA